VPRRLRRFYEFEGEGAIVGEYGRRWQRWRR
jgi:hypothetical protein